VPCGLVDGLPVGLQIVGRRGEDALVLRAARAFERLCPWSYDEMECG
jgi:Asp-tRNA(Asn)/Glu-tRNA(Gln) amidotransferase A subunit family amidase